MSGPVWPQRRGADEAATWGRLRVSASNGVCTSDGRTLRNRFQLQPHSAADRCPLTSPARHSNYVMCHAMMLLLRSLQMRSQHVSSFSCRAAASSDANCLRHLQLMASIALTAVRLLVSLCNRITENNYLAFCKIWEICKLWISHKIV